MLIHACSLFKPVIDTARVGLTEEFVLPRTVLRTVFRTVSIFFYVNPSRHFIILLDIFRS